MDAHRRSPMTLPPIEALLGASADAIEPLIDYGYRGAWRVRVRGDAFMVKSDTREHFQRAEVDAQLHAGNAGVPVPEIIAFVERPVPTVAMRWVDGVALRGMDHAEAWRDAGRVLRLIHRTDDQRLIREPWADLVLRWLADGLRYLVEHRGLAPGEADDAMRHAEALRALLGDQTLTWLHGDCQADHVLIDPATLRVVAVVDWSDAAQGDPVMDFAVLSLFADHALPHLLDGYDASAGFRDHLASTLLLYRALRGVGVVRWLDEHGFRSGEWPIHAVRAFARSTSS
ncbi:MAG: aminoglycoside phosphotransferase family protein [Dehalococcoidia bacterium]